MPFIKINKKWKFDKNKIFKYEFKHNQNGINYLCNNHIINSNIYKLLVEMKYKLNDFIKKFDLYFIGNKKILLLSNKIGGNKDIDEIGFINNKGIFIPEYILNYNDEYNISLDILNKFFKWDFFNIQINKEADICEIKNDEKNIGQCFKLNFEANNIINIFNDKEKNEINNMNVSPNKIIIDTFLESQIKALISYYLFNKKLKQNINSAEIIKSECYLIEENWMKKYKDFLLYGNLKQEINNSLLNENYKVENIYEKYLNNYLIKIKDFEKKICKDIQNIEPSKEIDIFESGELNNIIKYNNLRLYIIDKETYKYMNRDPNKKIIFSQEKNYIINEGKIFISLSINSINKFEILICTLDSEKNHIIPELLYKYNLITLMQQDMDFLSQNDFTKFKNERISSNNNELINNNKNNNKEIQLKIFDLKSLNLLEQINKNVTINNKTQSISENDDEQNKTKKKTEINNNSRLSIQFEQEMNKDETKEILRNIQKKIKIYRREQIILIVAKQE